MIVEADADMVARSKTPEGSASPEPPPALMCPITWISVVDISSQGIAWCGAEKAIRIEIY